ncbi:uncharacterized protein METZ01_LOCUS354816, partial [marine metagenome]
MNGHSHTVVLHEFGRHCVLDNSISYMVGKYGIIRN